MKHGRYARLSLSPRQELGVVAVHALSTWFMVGMIWTVHIVHYPLFAFVGNETYEDFQAKHVDVIGRLLIAPWLVEGLTALALLLCLSGSLRKFAVIGALLMLSIMALSAFVSAPAHGELANGFDLEVHGDLMLGNLLRSVLWTARGCIAATILWLTVRPPVGKVIT